MRTSLVAVAASLLSMAVQAPAQSTQTQDLSGFLSAVQSLASELAPSTTSTSQTTSSSSSSTSSSLTSTSSRPSTISSTPSATSATTPTSVLGLTTAAATSGSAAAASSTNSGISDQTRNIIIGVTVPVGLILLGLLILLLFCCCRRRRRREERREASEETRFVGNDDWSHHNNEHHGYPSDRDLAAAGAGAGAGALAAHERHHDHSPLVGKGNHHEPVVTEQHPAYRNEMAESNAYDGPTMRNALAESHGHKSMTPPPPGAAITRKPVPNRASTGSNISGTSGHNTRNNNHHHAGLAAGAGAGAIAGAAAMHHHDKHRQSTGSNISSVSGGRQDRPRQSAVSSNNRQSDPFAGPLTSHPSTDALYATTGPREASLGRRQSTPPFSPDDVGSMHRRSNPFAAGAIEPTVAAHPTHHEDHHDAAHHGYTITAPTAAQRRSLQSRNSGSYSGNDDTSRVPSRSPHRRSLTNGGELWQAEADPIPTTNRYSSGSSSDNRRSDPSLLTSATTATTATTAPSTGRYSSPGTDARSQPALPSTRHQNTSQQRPRYRQNNDSTYGSGGGDSSGSGEEIYDTPQEEMNPWDYDDSGRYPRFSEGSMGNRISGGSNAPLIAPGSGAWMGEGRYSGEQRQYAAENDGYQYGRGYQQPSSQYVPPYAAKDVRRSGGGVANGAERRQRLRFSDGHDLYDENGLVGRAL